MRFLENSAVFRADRVQTPILMLHNDGDDAVPWYQGIEFYLALRRLGKPVYMFNYNGEPHGLRKRVNQKDYTVRLQQFFDHCLKGAPMPEWMWNDEAWTNLAYAGLKKTHDTGVEVIKMMYGIAPRVTYFGGQSHGGREALTVANMFPQDYDGILGGETANESISDWLSGMLLEEAVSW